MDSAPQARLTGFRGTRHRSLLRRVVAYFLGPIYYWADLLDNERRPSHSKVTWTLAFAVALLLLIKFAHHVFFHHDEPTQTELAFLLAYAVLTFSLAGGLDGFKCYLKTRGGGTVQAFSDIATADSPGKARLDE